MTPPDPSLQSHYSPAPSVRVRPGQRGGPPIESLEADPGAGRAGRAHADWQPLPHHPAFDGVLNGGIIGSLLDCHSNWTAAIHLMRDRGLDGPPGCVTAEYASASAGRRR